MKGLSPELVARARKWTSKKSALAAIDELLSEVGTDDLDFEHLITFLANTPSAVHRELARQLRVIFVEVLRAEMRRVEKDLSGPPSFMYSVLFDMYCIPQYHETLTGVLTLNYDPYLEIAYKSVHGCMPSLVANVGDVQANEGAEILKLHGSLDWTDSWPIARGRRRTPLWIPPGIQKEKSAYPFNLIWGRAREVVHCDVLRIVGCRLSANDWDLVALLFSMQKARAHSSEYAIEVIGFPEDVKHIRRSFPYLKIRSIPECPDVGPRFVSEMLAIAEMPFERLDPEQQRLSQESSHYRNPFADWLRHKAELAKIEHAGSIASGSAIARFIEGRRE
jgi:hypothetical protein